jgi:indole-3-glycerol phosphate synthase
MPTTLDRILAATRDSLPELRTRQRQVEAAAADAPAPVPFLSRWDRSHVGLIAEVKRRSPSQGTISATLDPAAHAAAYAGAGAAAISVLTDGPFFGGSIADLAAVHARLGPSMPLLRKDFIVDELQLAEARATGAAAVLLIVRALTPARLGELAAAAHGYGLDVLVETHDERELEIALASGASLIGVNSRNLDTFEIDIDSAWGLIETIPADRIAIAESGMETVDDVVGASAAGADFVLIGTALSSSFDPAALATVCARVLRRPR